MCLAIPGLVIEVNPGQQRAIIDTTGLKRWVGIHLVGDVKPGDYLIVHAGYAIEKIDPDAAEQQLRYLEEIANALLD